MTDTNTNNSKLTERARRAGTLLAQSLLDKEYKAKIAKKVPHMSEFDLSLLLSALEREQKELDALMRDIESVLLAYNEEWAGVEQEQKQKADKLVQTFADELTPSD